MSNTNITITVTGISPDDLQAIVAALNKRGGSVTLVAQDKDEERAPDALARGHNPQGLTNAQVGVSDGYRLLDPDEIKTRDDLHVEIEVWSPYGTWYDACRGSLETVTYRTKLSREELAKLP